MPRGCSSLRSDAELEDRVFAEFPALLRAGDVLVLNETRVVRARLRATRAGGASAEVLLLRPRDGGAFDPAAREWLALVRPGRKLRAGARLTFGETGATVVEVLADGPRVLRFDEGVDVGALLEHRGEVPLPPYVGEGDPSRGERYQTVFARVPGSVAAPTASLHFTDAVLDAVRARGVDARAARPRRRDRDLPADGRRDDRRARDARRALRDPASRPRTPSRPRGAKAGA